MGIRVGLVTDDIDDGNAGLASYAQGLAVGFQTMPDEVDVTLIHRREHPFYDGRQHMKVAGFGAGRTATKGFGNKIVRKQFLMPWALRQQGFEVVHDTYHYAPFLPPTPHARVLTIHDLVPLVMPEMCACSVQSFLTHRTLVWLLARRATHIIADSNCTKRDVVSFYGVDPESISVVYLAAGESYRPITAEADLARVRAKFDLPERFILYLGTIEPRKNLVRLIRAYKSAAGMLDDVPLVLGGGLGWKYGEILQAANDPNLKGRVRLLGRVPDEDLPSLYSLATVFAFPSLYEGFGLPLVEAMACGCPVITSRVSSLPEVVGDAGLLVNPQSVGEIAQAMVDVVSHPQLRLELAAKGIARARQFSWRRCAEETLDVYRDAARVR